MTIDRALELAEAALHARRNDHKLPAEYRLEAAHALLQISPLRERLRTEDEGLVGQ